jgi:hypothetical protein
MRPIPRSPAAAVFVWLSFSGAALAQTGDPVPVYDATQVAFNHYTVIKRVGLEGWRSAFRIPGHGNLAAARQAVLAEAASVGADAVVNLMCFDQTDRVFKPAGYFCYGSAVRVNQ